MEHHHLGISLILCLVLLSLIVVKLFSIRKSNIKDVDFRKCISTKGQRSKHERPEGSTVPCFKNKVCQKQWGQLLPLEDVDADIFDGKEEFEKELVINITDSPKGRTFVLHPLWDIQFTVRLSEDFVLTPMFEDWSHESSDNSMILSAADESHLADLKALLRKEIATFCRQPLPRRYYLSMKPYPDRQTAAILRNFSADVESGVNYRWFENMEARTFQRTLNEPCSNSVPTPLQWESNSFYCTTNSPLVTEVFEEHLTDSYVDQRNERCDKARRICQLCLMRSCGVKHVDWNMRLATSALLGSNSSCCQIPCYASPHCLQYFNRECYPLDRYHLEKPKLCFRGKTLKFTLTPDFDSKNGGIQCHIRRRIQTASQKVILEFVMNFTTLGKKWNSRTTEMASGYRSNSYQLRTFFHFFPEQVVHFLKNHFIFELRTNIPDLEEGILVKNVPNNSTEPEFFLIDLARRGMSPSYQKCIQLFRQREQKYIKFQNIKPFQFNTENWHKQGCSVQITTRTTQEQSTENATYRKPVAVHIAPPQQPGAPFAYIINEIDHKVQLQISAKGNHRSLMHALFCNSPQLSKSPKLSHQLLRDAEHKFELGLTKLDKSDWGGSCKFSRSLFTLNGWVTGTPIYVALKLGTRSAIDHDALNVSDDVLIDKDVILFSSRRKGRNDSNLFSLTFEIVFPIKPLLLVYVHLSDCQSEHYFQYLIKDAEIQQDRHPALLRTPREMSVMLIDTQGLHTPLPFLLLSIFLGSLYLVLFIAFLMLCLCKPKRRQFIVPALLFQSSVPLNSRASSLSSALTEAAKSSTSALVMEDASLYSSPTRENSTGVVHSSRRLPATDSIPTSRKILIFLYVCFRAFTIFLFTFSVGLSVLLSIESESFKTLISCVQNAKGERIRELVGQEAIRRTFPVQSSRRTASPWLKELRQIEKASDIELTSQTANFIRQTSTCEMQELRVSGEVGLLMAEVASLVATRTDINVSGNRLSPNDPQNFLHHMAIANTTWDYLEIEHWNPYNMSIQRYMEDTRGLLDNQMVQHWSPYTLLLERMLENPWLATARRAMNATNEVLQSPELGRFSVRSPSASGYFAVLTPADPREVEALTFAGFLGIPQPANARYAEARMWNSLRQNVHTLKLLRYFENVKNMESSAFLPQAAGLIHSPDPFKYYTYSENFTADDFDAIPPNLAAGILREQAHQRGLTPIPATKNANEASSLREWINIAYLRVFLLVLDAYLIVSRFYSACRNFCALWLGKRRRVYHNTSQRSTGPSKRQTPNEHCNDALLLTSSETEHTNSPNELHPPASPTACPTENTAQNIITPNRPPSFDGSGDQGPNLFSNHTESHHDRADNSAYAPNTLPRHTISANELSNDPEAADFTGFSRRGSLPACCCCLDFHYLLILFGICLMITGLVISTGAGKGLGNTWLLKRSALLSRVEAMDDYRRHMRTMVHYVQLNYLNSQRLPLERNKATRQLRRLQRIQHWLYYEKEHILRQNLYEVCALSESPGRNQHSFYALDSSICHQIRQDQQRRQQYPYSNMALRKPQKSTSFMPSQDQLKLPFCTLLPVQSADALNATLNTRERHTILGTERSVNILSEQELRQLHQMFFKNSAFAAFLTSLYRLLFTTLLLSMCVCWLLACKHLIMQMATRTVAVVTSRVTVISPCPPEIRRIETFIHSSDSSLSFHRPAAESVASTRLNIWHFDDDPSEDLQDPHYPPTLSSVPQMSKHSAPSSLTSSVSCKKSKKHFHLKGKSIQTKTQTDSAESQV